MKRKEKGEKKKKKKKSSGGGGGAPMPLLPPPTMALHLITLISHKPWVPYYQTLSSISIHLYGKYTKIGPWPLTYI